MTDTYELTWKRSVAERRIGEPVSWVAADTRQEVLTVYTVRRNPDAQPGRQWTLAVRTGRENTQTRTGFDRLFTAKGAALHTRCHLCGRFLPFATLEQSGNTGGWRCRDHEECARIAAERDAEQRRIHRAIRNTPWTDVSIRDAEDGPELVFRTDANNSTVIRATEPDLIRLVIVLLERLGPRVLP